MNDAIEGGAFMGRSLDRGNVATSGKKRSLHNLAIDLFALMMGLTMWLIIVAVFVGFAH
ncbi:MAG: hypothetical protein WC725_04175 [Patescibacteria group bacterium]|jgi:hypothetical protein